MKTRLLLLAVVVGVGALILSKPKLEKSQARVQTSRPAKTLFAASTPGQKINRSLAEKLSADLKSKDDVVRGTGARFARALLVEWTTKNPPEDWYSDPETNRFFAQLNNVDDPELKLFKDLNPNSRALRYLRELSERTL